MLTIVNYKKIKNQWFGDWQIGKILEEKTHYALQAFHNSGKRSVTIVLFREEKGYAFITRLKSVHLCE